MLTPPKDECRHHLLSPTEKVKSKLVCSVYQLLFFMSEWKNNGLGICKTNITRVWLNETIPVKILTFHNSRL